MGWLQGEQAAGTGRRDGLSLLFFAVRKNGLSAAPEAFLQGGVIDRSVAGPESAVLTGYRKPLCSLVGLCHMEGNQSYSKPSLLLSQAFKALSQETKSSF